MIVLFAEYLQDELGTLWWFSCCQDCSYHDQLSFDISGAGQGIVLLACTERVRMNVGRKVADCGTDAFVQCTTICEMATQAHACRAYTSITCW